MLYQKLLNEIDINYSKIYFSSEAKFMGYSESYFSKVFNTFSGMTFTEYLNTVRVEKAIELLKSENIKITNIASQCGFNTIRQFNRVFKKVTDCSPSKITPEFSFKIYKTSQSNDSFNPTLPQSKLL